MSLSSHQNTAFDTRLLEIEELYRQRKPDVAEEKIRSLAESDFKPEGYDIGLFKLFKARERFISGAYKESIALCEEANKILAKSAFHGRVGLIQLLLYRNYSALGNLKKAEEYLHDALAFFKRIEDYEGMIDALNGLAKLAFIHSDYSRAIDYINDSIDISKGDNIRMTRLIGNLGRVEILCGKWDSAERNLKTALKLSADLEQPVSSARNHLSLGFLYLRQRHFALASREFHSARILIDGHKMPRENIILLEYEGEMYFEMGDIIQAKKTILEALDLSRKIAPESTLVSQLTRRLSQVELALDNIDVALIEAQKGLDIAGRLSERTEIGMSRIVIAEIFAAQEKFERALEYAQEGLEILRQAGDPYDLAKGLLSVATVYIKIGTVSRSRITRKFDQAFRIFNNLKLFYWSGETRFRQGVFCCDGGFVSEGFRNLHEAEKIFEKISERAKFRAIQLFLQNLSKRAVDLSISADNEYKIFGNFFNESEYSEIKTGDINELLQILAKRAGADRCIIYGHLHEGGKVITPLSLTPHQLKRFIQQFQELLGEEFSREKPTMLFDTRRDPFINELLPAGENRMIISVIVTPLRLSEEITGYLYLDKTSSNGHVIPFGQNELNFIVGFADLLALKLAEHERQVLEEDNRRLKAQLLEEAAFPNIITRNKQMLEMLSRVQQVVDSDISISIEGETGCGKDLLAKTIHYGSNRRDKRFISVNCAALPESLLESELFGHMKGAFTGADRDKPGLFEEADGGTFFLDEIADMPMSIQAKVLRVLEEKEIVRLGETRPRKVDVRILSATNKDLKTEMEAGTFRQDLYYRLTALCFKIPPLRDRKEDVPLLISHFSGDKTRFTPEAMKALLAFDWPGNVRELENEVKKLILLSGNSGVIDVDLLSSKVSDLSGEVGADGMELNTDISFDDKFSLYDYLAEYEKRFIIKALRDQGGIKKHAAASLNIPESTLRLKIKQYNIDLDSLGSVH